MVQDGKNKPKGSSCNAMGMGCNTLAVECWKAQITRENSIRDEWRRSYAPHLNDLEAEVESKWNDRLNESKKLVDEVCIFIRVLLIEKKKKKKKQQMDGTVRSVLFDGVSKDGCGRSAYLKLRNKDSPQKKVRQPLTSSQLIGWQCAELPPVRNPSLPNFGRKPVIRTGFYRKGGVFTST